MQTLALLQSLSYRDLGDTKLCIPKGETAYDALKPVTGGTLILFSSE